MAYDNLSDFFDPTLRLPIGDVVYEIPAPSADEGLRLRAVARDETLTDAAELDEVLKILGPVHDQLVAAGLSWPEIWHTGRTALLHFGHSERVGQAHWRYGQLGEQVFAEVTKRNLEPPSEPPASRSRAKKAPAKPRATRSRRKA